MSAQPPWISVIIPARNEASCIAAAIASVRTEAGAEVIVVDGQSRDATAAIAAEAGARVLDSAPGCAAQLNCGAAHARGDILVFLHADTRLPVDYGRLVHETLRETSEVTGAFHLAIDAPGHALRLVEWGVRVRSRWGKLPYGDQALFLRRAWFDRLGGFPMMPIMEDYAFIRKARRRGRVRMAPGHVRTSARRWLTCGVWRTTLVHQVMITAYHLGVSTHRLARWTAHVPSTSVASGMSGPSASSASGIANPSCDAAGNTAATSCHSDGQSRLHRDGSREPSDIPPTDVGRKIST